MDDLSNASSKLTETKMKVLHVDDYRDQLKRDLHMDIVTSLGYNQGCF